jgi:hypothetical protein
MSFREKSAWISLICLALVFGVYFGTLLSSSEEANFQESGHAFVLAVIILVTLEVVLHVLAAWRAPDARSPADERERLIALKATRVAFYVLAAGAFLASVAIVHAPANRWLLANAVLFAIVTAEVVKFGVQVVLYRRGA